MLKKGMINILCIIIAYIFVKTFSANMNLFKRFHLQKKKSDNVLELMCCFFTTNKVHYIKLYTTL